jgi:hypothetical protein
MNSNPFIRTKDFRVTGCCGSQWVAAVNELPEDQLDRLVRDPRRPGVGDEVAELEDEC